MKFKLNISSPFSRALLITVLVCGLTTSGSPFFKIVKASTEITGIINVDTTWTKAGSPYSLVGNVLVGNGATLTIEAGATVNLNDFYLMVNGTLRAQGSETEQIQFNSGEIQFTLYGNDWNEQTGTGCIIENTVFNAIYVEIGSVSVRISKCTGNVDISGSGHAIICDSTINGEISGKLIKNNELTGEAKGNTVSNNTIVGKVSGSIVSYNNIIGQVDVSGGSVSSFHEVISHNNITNSNAADSGIRCNGYAVISNNKIFGCGTGISLYPVQVLGGTSNAFPLIEKNLITNNTCGINITLMSRFEPRTSAPTIQNNTIINNSVGISIQIYNYDGTPTIIYNNIHDNFDYNMALTEETQNNVEASNNWWGTNGTQAINQTIFDFKNDFNLGKVNFVPFLTEPNKEAQPIPEFTSWIILPFILIGFILTIVFGKRLKRTD